MSYLDGGQNDGSVSVSEPRGDSLADVLSLSLVSGDVARESVQDEHLKENDHSVSFRDTKVPGRSSTSLAQENVKGSWILS